MGRVQELGSPAHDFDSTQIGDAPANGHTMHSSTPEAASSLAPLEKLHMAENGAAPHDPEQPEAHGAPESSHAEVAEPAEEVAPRKEAKQLTPEEQVQVAHPETFCVLTVSPHAASRVACAVPKQCLITGKGVLCCLPPQAEAEKNKRKRMYFVRFPKPPEVMPAEVHSLETEVEVYRQTLRHLSATVDSLRVSRASRGNLASSRCWGPLPCPLSCESECMPVLCSIWMWEGPPCPEGSCLQSITQALVCYPVNTA